MSVREETTRSAVHPFLAFWTEERSLTIMLVLLLLHFFVLTPGKFLGHAFQMLAALFLSFALLAGILALQQRVVRRLYPAILIARLVTLQFETRRSGPGRG